MVAHFNPRAATWRAEPIAGSPIDFHRTMSGYAPTPMVEVPRLAEELGLGRVLLKDESARLGLPAFKILGASYAISRALSARLGEDGALPLADLRGRLAGSGLRLSAATEGNHGRAVAHVAALLGLAATIYIPTGVSGAAQAAIRAEGATLVEHAAPYDDVVTHAAQQVDESTIIIQDTSWPTYEDIPGWIVEGYTTMLREIDDALGQAPDAVVVPVGVGSLAHAVLTHYRSGAARPAIIGVEPELAPSLTAALTTGAPTAVATGETIMTGLNCGTISHLAWPALRGGLSAAVTVDEEATATAVADLAHLGVDAGPCGAASLAGLRTLRMDSRTVPLVGPESVVVLLSTEGRAANPK